MNSEYQAVSSQLIGEVSTFCGITIDYKAYIGCKKGIIVYDTVKNDYIDPIPTPDWVLKIVQLSKTHILCGLRGASIIILNIETRVLVASYQLNDTSINDICPASFRDLTFVIAGMQGLWKI